MVYEGFISDLCKETQLEENKAKIDFNEVLQKDKLSNLLVPNSKKIMENELNVIENLPIIDEEYNIAFIKDSKTNDYKHLGQILPNQFYILHCSNLISTELLEIIAYNRYTTRYPFADSLELRRRQQASLKQILKMLSYINFEVKDMIGVKYQV